MNRPSHDGPCSKGSKLSLPVYLVDKVYEEGYILASPFTKMILYYNIIYLKKKPET